jgi:hypothetical protein
VALSDGGHVSGTFSAPVCGLHVDACTLVAEVAESCIAQSCVP